MRRFLYTMGGQPLPEPVEVSTDFQATPERADTTIMAGRLYENLQGPDGADWGSRAKRKEDMRLKGLADLDDFKGAQQAREKDIQERRARMEGTAPPPRELIDHVGRVAYEMKERGRRR